MALIPCPECSREISDRAKTCPHCGVDPSAWVSEEERKRRTYAWAIFIVILGALFYIGSLDSEADPEPATTHDQKRSLREKHDITPASGQQLESINYFLEDGLRVTHGYRVRSGSHEHAYYVGAYINGVGLEDEVGIWLMSGEPNEVGMTLSVNAIADEFSVAPDGGGTKARTSSTDDEARALRRYMQ